MLAMDRPMRSSGVPDEFSPGWLDHMFVDLVSRFMDNMGGSVDHISNQTG